MKLGPLLDVIFELSDSILIDGFYYYSTVLSLSIDYRGLPLDDSVGIRE